jgi:hypothetical protein
MCTLRGRCDKTEKAVGSVEILLALELAPEDRVSAVGATLSRLAILDGELVTWILAEDGTSAKVTFRLGNSSRGDRFQAEAIAIPGVSLESPQNTGARNSAAQR